MALAPDPASFLARLNGATYTAPEGSPLPPSPPRQEMPWEKAPGNMIKKVSYTHDAMIDLIIREPMITQLEIASYFGYHPNWVSQLINSEAFKGRLHQRKSELTDPLIIRSIEERINAAAQRSLDLVLEKLETASLDQALRVATAMTSSLGYGARPGGNSPTQIAVVVNVPSVAKSPEEWSAKYSKPPPTILENSP